MLHTQCERIIGLERNLTGDKLVQQNTERIDIRGWLGWFPPIALWSHIGRGSIDLTRSGQGLWRFIEFQLTGIEKTHNAKVGEIDLSLFVDEDVTWLDVSMNHSMLMSIVNRAGKLAEIPGYLGQR
jgi:hypothetical protein